MVEGDASAGEGVLDVVGDLVGVPVGGDGDGAAVAGGGEGGAHVLDDELGVAAAGRGQFSMSHHTDVLTAAYSPIAGRR